MNVPDVPPPGTSRPPSIPRVRSSGSWDQPEHLLLWVRTGSACIRMGDSPEYRLAEGEGVWIPADPGHHWTVVTEPGTVAFPLLTHPSLAAEAVSEPRRFVVPAGSQDWLIQHFNLMVTPLTGHGYSQGALVDLLRGSGRRPPPPRADSRLDPVGPPIMPKAGGARKVADALLRNPALDLTVDEWAAQVLSSPRTLLRDFRADTGLTFEQWRLRCRLSAAVEFLAAGFGIDQVAARVGFATRSGFTRAFRQQFGSTPHEFSRTLSANPAARDHSRRTAAVRRADDLVTMMRVGGSRRTHRGCSPRPARPCTPTSPTCSAGRTAVADTWASATVVTNGVGASRPGSRRAWSTSRVCTRTRSRCRSGTPMQATCG